MATAAYYLVCYATTVRQLNRVIAITELKGNQQQKEEVIHDNNSGGKREQSKCVTQAADVDLIQWLEILWTFQMDSFLFLSAYHYTALFSELEASNNRDTPTTLQSHKNKLVGIRRLTKIMNNFLQDTIMSSALKEEGEFLADFEHTGRYLIMESA